MGLFFWGTEALLVASRRGHLQVERRMLVLQFVGFFVLQLFFWHFFFGMTGLVICAGLYGVAVLLGLLVRWWPPWIKSP